MYSQIRENNDIPTKQTIQHLQGGAGPGVPAGILYGARGTAYVRAGRDVGGCRRACAVGSIHGAQMLQIRDA